MIFQDCIDIDQVGDGFSFLNPNTLLKMDSHVSQPHNYVDA